MSERTREMPWDTVPMPAADAELESTLPVLSPESEEITAIEWEIEVDAHGATDTGLVRASNEDQFLIAELERQMLVRDTSVESTAPTRYRRRRQAVLLAVADGMGGHAGGSMASRVVIDALAGYLLRTLPWAGTMAQADLASADEEARRALVACQRRLTEVADRKGLLGGQPGTTLTAAHIAWPQLLVLHVGDSRLYLMRDGQLAQLTTDHTVLPDQRAHRRRSKSPLRHILTNAIVGGPDRAIGEIHRIHLDPNDRVLLCTDGLTEHVPDEQIAASLAENDDMGQTCADLLAAARHDGGTDNITVVAARFLPRH
jgi:serine/threonine protein phosphatase PrpC